MSVPPRIRRDAYARRFRCCARLVSFHFQAMDMDFIYECPCAVLRTAQISTNVRVIRALVEAPFVWIERLLHVAKSYKRAFKLWIHLMELAYAHGFVEQERCLINMLEFDPLAHNVALYSSSPFQSDRGINFGYVRRALSSVMIDDTNFDTFVTRTADIFGQGLVHGLRGAAKWVPKESCVRRARGKSRYPIVKAVFDRIVNEYFAGSRSFFRSLLRLQNEDCLENCLANGFEKPRDSFRIKVGKGACKRYRNILKFKNQKIAFFAKCGFRLAKGPQERVPWSIYQQFRAKSRYSSGWNRSDWTKDIRVPVLSPCERSVLGGLTVCARRGFNVLKQTVEAFGSTFEHLRICIEKDPRKILLFGVPHKSRVYPWVVQWRKSYDISIQDFALYKLIARRRARGHVSKRVHAWLSQ